MSVIGSNLLAGAAGQAGAAGYQIERSLRFNDDDGAKLTKTFSSAGNQKKWTWSGWVKRSSGGSKHHLFAIHTADNNSGYFRLAFNSDNTLFVGLWSKSILTTDAVFRDFSAWMHIVLVLDTANSTAADRIILYVNGVRQSVTGSADNDTAYAISSAGLHNIGSQTSTSQHFDGYLAEVHFIDGQALAATDFGDPDDNNVWQPKEYSGTYGTNGFYLDFSDNSSASALGTDAAGSNDWTVNYLSVAAGAGNDSLIDTPTNYEATSGNNGGNYCTLNPLAVGSGTTLSNGNLDAVSGSSWSWAKGTIGVTSGKWYWEVTKTNAGADNLFTGIVKTTFSNLTFDMNHANASSNDVYGYTSYNGNKEGQGSSTSYGATFQTAGDVIGVALDMDAGTLTFYKNGATQGQAFSGITDEVCPAWGGTGSSISAANMNFGQRPFAISSIPTGYKSLCTQNLDDPTIADGSTAFDIALWTGNGSTQTISGLNLSPDFVWIKNRSGSYNHHLVDTVRGANNGQNVLYSNLTNAEGATNSVTAFTSDGFTVAQNSSVNHSSNAIVGWAWDAGTSTVSNTDGSITSSVRANASAGFSIVTWTGNSGTVGHGLNAAPGLIISKIRNTGSAWPVQHSYDTSKFLTLNTTDAASSDTTRFGAAPTSSVFSVGSWWNSDSDGVAYCLSPVEGFSAFGSYQGNGSSDGPPMVYTGFKIRWLLIKLTSGTSDWRLFDTARSSFNAADILLFPSSAEVEATDSNYSCDILSNGFKMRNTHAGLNANNATYIYAAFAEHPLSLNGGLAR